MAPTKAPMVISDLMRTVLLSSNTIMSTPAPSVDIKSMDAQAIELELSFRVRDFATASTAKHEVYDLIYRHARAAGLALAQPKEASAVIIGQPPAPGPVLAPRNTTLRLVDAVPLFSSLTEEEKAALAATMTRKTYRKGEVLAEQGAKLNSLMVIRNGVLVVSRREGDHDIELGRLAPGDYFGEDGLFTGTGEAGTVRALTSAVVYEVGQTALAKLMHDRPSLADEISVTLARRAKIGTTGGKRDVMAEGSVTRLVARIRQLFEVPHG
jgi:CRP-like cAMP-binding protein